MTNTIKTTAANKPHPENLEHELTPAQEKELRRKLITSLAIDALGFVSYSIPFLGEFSDLLLAPVHAIWIKTAYKNTWGAVGGFMEEILPFSDFIPSCTINHIIYANKLRNPQKKKRELTAEEKLKKAVIIVLWLFILFMVIAGAIYLGIKLWNFLF